MLHPRIRPQVTRGITTRINTACRGIYVTINRDENGIAEVFIRDKGKAGSCKGAQLEGLGRMISLSLRLGADMEDVIKQLSGLRCPDVAYDNGETVSSCCDAVAVALKRHAKELTDGTG